MIPAAPTPFALSVVPERRSRWCIALAALPGATALVTANLPPSPHGHWVEHLSGVGFKVTQIVVLVALTVMLGARRLPKLLIAVLVVGVVGIALQSYGDARVADSIWKTAADPGSGPGYEAGHDISAWGDLAVLLTGFGFAAAAALTRRVNPSVALLAAVLVIIPPPFFWTAAGVLFVLLHALTTSRSLPMERAP